MTRRKKIAVIVAALCGCALVFSVAALTVARPLTAKVYHSIRSWYIEYSQKEELEALYDYQPESPERFDVTAVSLPTVQPLTAEEEALYQKTVLAVLQEDLSDAPGSVRCGELSDSPSALRILFPGPGKDRRLSPVLHPIFPGSQRSGYL